MTLGGTVVKTGLLTVFAFASAAYTWHLFLQAEHNLPRHLCGEADRRISIIAMITIFKSTWSPVTAPLYAVLEGFALGGISAATATQYGNIPIMAVGLTFATLAAMLVAYTTGLIRAPRF